MAETRTTDEPLRIGNLTLPHRLVLAPLCGITHKPFRLICKDFGAGLVFNQMVSAKALTMRDKKSLAMLSYNESERPVGMQLFGNDADVLGDAARIVQDTGPDVVDLNLGCPAKKIVNDGGGAALMSDEVKLGRIFRSMRRSLNKIPFTIKMRAGWDDSSRNALSVAQIAVREGVDAVTIHARTRAQGYAGKSDWEFIRHLKENISIPVIGNGDVFFAEDARRMMTETGCDAVMTGRGAFQTPWIFQSYVNGEQTIPAREDLLRLILQQYESFMSHFGAAGGIKMMRKHLCVYTHGLRGGAEFRNQLVRMDEWAGIDEAVRDFFSGNEDLHVH